MALRHGKLTGFTNPRRVSDSGSVRLKDDHVALTGREMKVALEEEMRRNLLPFQTTVPPMLTGISSVVDWEKQTCQVLISTSITPSLYGNCTNISFSSSSI